MPRDWRDLPVRRWSKPEHRRIRSESVRRQRDLRPGLRRVIVARTLGALDLRIGDSGHAAVPDFTLDGVTGLEGGLQAVQRVGHWEPGRKSVLLR